MLATSARTAAERLAIAAASTMKPMTTTSTTSNHSTSPLRRALFGDASVLSDDTDTDDIERHSDAATSAYSLDPARSDRRVLLGVSALLALLCAFMSAFEGYVSPVVVRAIVTSDASSELLRVARTLPVFGVLLLLLDKTASPYLWSLQLLVASKIHTHALFPVDADDDRKHWIASGALVAMLLAHAALRFGRPTLAAPWAVAAAVLTLAASAVLAAVDTALLAGSSLLLLNAGFLACTTCVMGGLASDAQPLSTAAAAVAVAIVALGASLARERAGVTDSAFAVSVTAQLVLALLASRELAVRRRDSSSDGVDDVDADYDVWDVADECAGGDVFQCIELLVTLASVAAALLALVLLLSSLRHLTS